MNMGPSPPLIRTIALAMVSVVLASCTQAVRLSAVDRHQLSGHQAIHVVHYETPPPTVTQYSKVRFPAPTEVYRSLGHEPAAPVAERLSKTLARKGGLRNLNVDPQPRPRPVPDATPVDRSRFTNGLVLELWIDQWTFGEIAGKPGLAAMRLNARSRLSRASDGKTLWSTGRCQVGGPQHREYRIASADLSNSGRLRRLVTEARNECVRQIARDFDDR